MRRRPPPLEDAESWRQGDAGWSKKGGNTRRKDNNAMNLFGLDLLFSVSLCFLGWSDHTTAGRISGKLWHWKKAEKKGKIFRRPRVAPSQWKNGVFFLTDSVIMTNDVFCWLSWRRTSVSLSNNAIRKFNANPNISMFFFLVRIYNRLFRMMVFSIFFFFGKCIHTEGTLRI